MIRVRGMTFEDLTLGLRLKQRAGWNQTAADWTRFLSLQPDGCFVAEHDGTAAPTHARPVSYPQSSSSLVIVCPNPEPVLNVHAT